MREAAQEGLSGARRKSWAAGMPPSSFSQGQAGDIVFVKDDKGRAAHLLVREGGQDIKVTRIK